MDLKFKIIHKVFLENGLDEYEIGDMIFIEMKNGDYFDAEISNIKEDRMVVIDEDGQDQVIKYDDIENIKVESDSMARRKLKVTKSKKLIDEYFNEADVKQRGKLIEKIGLEIEEECWQCTRFKLNNGKCYGLKTLSSCLAFKEIEEQRKPKAC